MANDNDEILKDPSNWIKVEAKGMKRVDELEIATIVYEAVQGEIGNRIVPDDVLGAQMFEQAWIVYTSGQVAKAKILSVGTITVHGKTFQLSEYSQRGIRISIHGIPLHISDEEVEQWVDTFAVRVTDVEKHDMLTKGKSKVAFKRLLSGHRFCYASIIHGNMPRFICYDMPNPMDHKQLMKANVTVYFNDQIINCRYCKELDHDIDSCPILQEKQNKVKCYACGANGHRSDRCELGKKIYAFNGAGNKLSNFYKCDLNVDGQWFSTSEQLYQWKKAMFHGDDMIAQEILTKEKPWDVKKLGDKIKDSEKWLSCRQKIMEEVLNYKIEQCEAFRDELRKTDKKSLVEATRDPYWGSGLRREETMNTDPQNWTGKNVVGKILTRLRKNMLEESTTTVHSGVNSDNNSGLVNPPSKQSEKASVDIQGNSADHGNVGTDLCEQLIDQAMGTKTSASPEILKKVQLYLEQFHSNSPSAASPVLRDGKRKKESPDAEPQLSKKEKKQLLGEIKQSLCARVGKT